MPTLSQAQAALRSTARDAAWWMRYASSAVPGDRADLIVNLKDTADKLDAAVKVVNDALDESAFRA